MTQLGIFLLVAMTVLMTVTPLSSDFWTGSGLYLYKLTWQSVLVSTT